MVKVSLTQSLLHDIAQQLMQKKLTIAVAESCTGGLLSHALTNIAGSSSYFERGLITYSNKAKQELLQVRKKTLETHGAVSAQTAKEMAVGVKNHALVDIGVATTGIAGPTGGTKNKPVGLVYVGVAYLDTVLVKEYHFHGNRLDIKTSTCNAVFQFIHDILSTVL